MYTVLNSNGQLALRYSNQDEFYQFPTFKSISSGFDTLRGNYYVSINFIANDKNNSLRLYLVDISNQPSWTDTTAGAKNAVSDISSWVATVVSPSLSGVTRRSRTLRVTNTAMITDQIYSISMANVGTANATISSDAGATYVTLKPNETISFDAGDINNYFITGSFGYNASTAGAELLIIYTY
jgi:hypothetical protein